MKSLLTADLLEDLHGWLETCAESGQTCPGNKEIARRYGFASGATAAKAIAKLEKLGRIRVRRGWTARQATILATGRSTAAIREPARGARNAMFKPDKGRPPVGPRVIAPKGSQCQWIDGEPSGDDDCKCLRLTVPGRSWCPAHLQRIHLPPEIAEARFGVLRDANGKTVRWRHAQ